MGSALAHGSDPLAHDRPLDDRAYSLDHIAAKLARLPGMMQTETGRALGEARLATLTAFRAAFAAEWNGAPPARDWAPGPLLPAGQSTTDQCYRSMLT